MVFEDVPQVSRRIGDTLLAGTNNSMILLGRDRLGSVDTGYGSVRSSSAGRGAGSVHVTVGRQGSDPSQVDDRASLYLSEMTDPDTAASTEQIGEVRRGVSAGLLRGDCLRMTARVDIKVSVGRASITMDQSGQIIVDGDVSLGRDAADRIIRGDAFSQFWNTVTVPTPMGPSGPPPPIPDEILSARNRVR